MNKILRLQKKRKQSNYWDQQETISIPHNSKIDRINKFIFFWYSTISLFFIILNDFKKPAQSQHAMAIKSTHKRRMWVDNQAINREKKFKKWVFWMWLLWWFHIIFLVAADLILLVENKMFCTRNERWGKNRWKTSLLTFCARNYSGEEFYSIFLLYL